jgi:hypothetical protein
MSIITAAIVMVNLGTRTEVCGIGEIVHTVVQKRDQANEISLLPMGKSIICTDEYLMIQDSNIIYI